MELEQITPAGGLGPDDGLDAVVEFCRDELGLTVARASSWATSAPGAVVLSRAGGSHAAVLELAGS